jgi:hypothetical protein
MSNNDKVLLDLNWPAFQSKLFTLDILDLKKILRTFEKLSKLTWNEVFRDHGLKWEEFKSSPGKYSIRLSQSHRAVITREGNFMRFQSIDQDHDRTYGKK